MEFMFSEENKVDGHNDSNKEVNFIQQIQQIHEETYDQLEKIQAKYKMRHDKHPMYHHFQVSD